MRRPDRMTLALAAVLLGALALRLWGIRSGLPFAYNADEERHFVPLAVRFFDEGLNPGYFLNPPGFTELLYVVYAVWFGGGGGVARAAAQHRDEVLLVGRVTAAVLGVVAVWLLALVGARLFDRAVGLLAAALGACAFLPVFYGHLALNDVPAMAPATAALLATAWILRGGGWRAVVLGGAAAGLAAGTKYTGGIVLLPLLTALLLQARQERRAAAEIAGLAALALAGTAAGFLVANPYALLDWSAFHAGIARQREYASGEELAKLGLTQDNGVLYYLWTLTWGLGWVPALAALGGAVRLALRDCRLALVLLPAPLLFLTFMGMQERYFGRWLLPILPIVILLAASFGIAVVRAVARRTPALAPPVLVLIVVALLVQGLSAAVHVDRVLAQPDTRNTLRAWMLTHVPAGARIVVEPVVPRSWLQDPDRASPARPNGARWRVWNTTRADVDDHARPLPGGRTRYVKVDRYERTLRPALLDDYLARGYCWVVIGSTQYERAYAEPDEVPGAIAYYRALARRGEEQLRVTPYRFDSAPPRFNFDWSFDYYPRAYARPGPELVVYRLRDARCAAQDEAA